MKTLVLLTVFSAAVYAADGVQVGLTISGFVFDPNSRALCPIIGVPGAAYVSDKPVVEDIEAAWVSPDRDHAIVLRAGKATLLRGLRSLAPQEQNVPELMAGVDLVVWSESGRLAALFAWDSAAVQVLRLGQSTAEIEAPVSVGALEGKVSAMAVSDAGRVAIGVGGTVYSVEGSNAPQPVIALQNGIAALSFCQGTLYAAATEGILRLQPGAAGVMISDFHASALACSPKAGRLLGAGSEEPATLIYDVATSTDVRVPLDRMPAALQPLNGQSLFLVNGLDRDGQPAIVLDASGTASTFFVPAGAASSL